MPESSPPSPEPSTSTRPNATEWNRRRNLRDLAAFKRRQEAYERDNDVRFRRVDTLPLPTIQEEEEVSVERDLQLSDSDSDSILVIDASSDSSFELIYLPDDRELCLDGKERYTFFAKCSLAYDTGLRDRA